MEILVTGATGFIGARLVEELLNCGYRVRVLTRKPVEQYKNIAWGKKVTFIQGDIKDRSSIKKAVQGVNVVIHLAAQLGSWRAKQEDYIDVNYNGTKLLVKESRTAGVQHFLYISTAGVFGTLKSIPADETHPCSPRYPYEKTKFIAEQYILSAIKEGFPATILRPSHVYGPGDLNTIPLLRLLQKVHFFPLIGGGKSFFQPVFIDDLIKGITCCLEHRNVVCGKVYILSGKEAVTFKEYIYLIAKIMGIKILTVPCPYTVAKLCAQLNEFIVKILNTEPILTRFRVDFFGGHQCYDIQRAQHDFKYNPKISIDQGMKQAIDWYRQLQLI